MEEIYIKHVKKEEKINENQAQNQLKQVSFNSICFLQITRRFDNLY